MKGLRVLSMSLLATSLLAVAVVAGGAKAASAAPRFGINAQFLFWNFPSTIWSQHVQEMRQDGVQVVRADAPWRNAEPNAPADGVHTYNWSSFDAIESVLAANHIEWQPIIDYSTPWAASVRPLFGSPDIFSPPLNDADFAAYAQAVARRYGTDGTFWQLHPELAPEPVSAFEIWNEENSSAFWQPRPNAAQYAALYESARSAIHNVNPGAEVMVGGLGNPSAPFLQSMYTVLGGAGRIDAVAIHPYADNPTDMYSDVVGTREVLERHGDARVPIDVTEFGWPTAGNPNNPNYSIVSDSTRARYIAQFVNAVAPSACGVDRLEPHTWVTKEQDLSNAEDWFGLVHPSGLRTQSALAYASVVRRLASTAAPASTPSASTCAQQLGNPSSTPLLPFLPLHAKRGARHGRLRHARLRLRRSRHLLRIRR